MLYDVIILGAGAAGLMSAISAGTRGKKCVVLESNDKPGLKILISGGGRCNFTNKVVNAEDYVSENPHFCKSALRQFTNQDFIEWVNKANISYYEKTLGQLFCESSSKEILNLLLQKLRSHKIEILTGQKIKKVFKRDDVFTVISNGEKFQSKKLIVATGGLSMPKLGASHLGYKIAKQFDHRVTDLQPALDGFVLAPADRKIFSSLAGISLPVKLKVQSRSFEENILFTHSGMSGPAALKGSLYWIKEEPVIIDFLPQISPLDWIEEKRKKAPKKLVRTVLLQKFPGRFGEIVLVKTNIENKKIIDLTKKEMMSLNHFLKEFSIIPESTVGYEKAEVTRGGVDTKDISSKTMESQLVAGLYFVGEVVDVTGLLGGFNFQWAWSSGWVAGQSL